MHNIRIWNPLAPATNCYVDFIKEFTLGENTCSITLKIAVDTEYVVWLNGQFAARGQYRTFPENPVYDTIDLSPFAAVGNNRLAVTVYYQGDQSYQYAKGEAGLWFTLHQGESLIALSDTTVLSAPSVTLLPNAHRVTPQYGFGFIYDARHEEVWQRPNTPIPPRFTGSQEYKTILPTPRPIQKCNIAPITYGQLIQQGTFVRTENGHNPALAIQTDRLSPSNQQIPAHNETNPYYIWDLGRETAGFIAFTVDVPAGTTIDLAWGEHINEHGVAAHVGGRNFANRYIAKEGMQTFTYYFRRIAGRYLQMHIAGQNYQLPKAGILEETYPVKLPPLPDTGNDKMNAILHTARTTLHQCMHEHYEDCPWREQAMYAGDSAYQILSGYYAFHETDFPHASLKLMGNSMRNNGFLGITAPTDEFLQIPIFTFLWMMAVEQYTCFTGNLSLAEQFFPAMVTTLQNCTAHLENHIAIHPFAKGIWNFYDWTEGSDGGNIFEPEPHLNYKAGHRDGLYQMFLVVALQSVIKLAEQLQKCEEIEFLSSTVSILRQGIYKQFWNEEKQLFASFVDNGKQHHYGQLMQALAVFNNIAPTHNKILCKALAEDKTLIPANLGHAFFRYEALLCQGDAYKEFVWQEILDKWGNMLDAGATTFWETELGAADFGGAGSLCHGWSAIPLYIICRYFLEITPDQLPL